MKRTLVAGLILGVVMVMTIPHLALAQTRNQNRDLRIDLRRDRDDLRKSDLSATTPEQRTVISGDQRRLDARADQNKPPTAFEFDLNVPFTYNTNVLSSTHGAQDDGHAAPDISLTWARVLDRFKVAILGDLNFDRYITVPDASSDTLFFAVTGSFTPSAGMPSLYIRYRPTLNVLPTLASLDSTFHDFMGGVLGTYKIATGDAKKPLSVDWDLNVGHRWSDPGKFDSTFGQVKLKASYKMTDALSVSLQPVLEWRSYERFEGKGRTDITPVTDLALMWAPSWLTSHPLLADAAVVGTVEFTHNYSDRRNQSFSQWDVGPALSVSWSF